MEEKRKCPVCNSFLIKRKVHIGVGAGGPGGKLPELETREAYQCPECKEVYFEEDLNLLKKKED